MTDLVDLQTAVRQVSGVASAVVRWPDPDGPASLKVEFVAGADRRAVTESVVRTMIDIGQIDMDTMQIETEAGPPPREGRPIFTDLLLERDRDTLAVAVTLVSVGRNHVGRAEGDGGDHNTLRLVCEATLDALNAYAGTSISYQLTRVDRVGEPGEDDQVTVQVRVDDQILLGAALVRQDAREAVVRATLDAVNRHVIQLPA